MKFTTLIRAIVLSAVGVVFLTAGSNAHAPRKIEIVAQRFAFEPSEITVSKGEPIVLIIHSKDVSHGLVIEELGVRTEVKKGQSTEVKFSAISSEGFLLSFSASRPCCHSQVLV